MGNPRLRLALIVALVLSPLAIIRATPAQAGEPVVPPGFIDEAVVTNLSQPTALDFTPDGRMLVTGKMGQIMVYKDDVFLGQAIDLAPEICAEWERGLTGIVVDPDFATNRTIYVYYTHKVKLGCPIFNDPDRAPISEFPENRVSKFILNDDNTINLSSEVVLLDHIVSIGIHNAGHLAFGPLDKLLYISVGDGGCKYPEMNDCQSANPNARRTDLLYGKILRINRDGSIPASNPYAADANGRKCGDPAGVPGGTGRCKEIFATGLRNPFRFAFQPGTQTFYINDVGTSLWEEIDLGAKGADYGYNIREGHCKNASTITCYPSADGSVVDGLTNPIFDYNHAATGCSSIVGGAFVPNGLWGAPYSGSYLFADFVCGKILRLAPKSGGGFQMIPFVENLGSSSAVHIQFGPFRGSQALYYTTFEEGDAVRRIHKATPGELPPTARFTASPMTSTAVPTTVTFNGSASTDPDNDDLDYHWNFGDGSPVQVTEEPVTTHTYGEGAFTAHLRVQDDAHMSVEATHVIEVGHPPAPTILTPSTTATFAINDMVNLSASASDPNETLDGSHFSWTVIRHHNNTHTHPFLGPLPGKTLSFHYPEPEDLDAAKDSKLEAILTVTDSTGIQRTVSRDLMPKKVQITIQDNRSTPLRLFANDLMYMGQGTFSSWPGYRIQLHAPSPQQFSDRYYRFDSWSDGKAQTHDIITGTANATYTANFTRVDGQAPAPPPPPPAPEIKGVQAIGRTPTGLGWWTAEADSEIKTFGNAVDYGDVSHIRLNKPVVGIAPTPSGKGYWMVATDGGVFSFGDADFWGSTGNVKLNQPVVGMASTPTGKGYYLVAADGGIFTFGDAVFKGSTGNVILKKPVVGMDVTPSGQGYWLVAADGGIFTFGNAPFKGTMANEFLAKPVVAMDSTPSGDGYWLMSSEGGVFTFGDADYFGSTASHPPAGVGVGIAATPGGLGYWLAFSEGTVRGFGNAPNS